MCKENLYAEMEKSEAQVCKCTRQGLLSYALTSSYSQEHTKRKGFQKFQSTHKR